MDDLHHHLLRLDGGQDILSHCLVLHPVAEILGHLVADIGVKQGLAYILYSLGDIDFGNLSFSLENLERSLKPFRQIFKHIATILSLSNICLECPCGYFRSSENTAGAMSLRL